VQSERSAFFIPQDARYGAAARSSSCSSKTCLLISYTTNAFPVRTFPLEHRLIAPHVLSQSSRVNMSLPVRLQLSSGIHGMQLTSIHQYSTTILVRRSLEARWMTCDVPSTRNDSPSDGRREDYQSRLVGYSRSGGLRPSPAPVLPPDRRLRHLLFPSQSTQLRKCPKQGALRFSMQSDSNTEPYCVVVARAEAPLALNAGDPCRHQA
jgi:hypothetical protein